MHDSDAILNFIFVIFLIENLQSFLNVIKVALERRSVVTDKKLKCREIHVSCD